jgi:segregation and condensation protein B
MEDTEIQYFIEAALLAAGRPLSIDQIQGLFDGRSQPDKPTIRKAIEQLNEGYEPRGIAIAEVASGFRIQIESTMAARLQKLWEERPPRYSRALFETLALIAYRQPITRGEIEDIRGVSVSSNIVRTLMERDWVRVVGHRDVPGRPAMFGTTKAFLDYFGLKKLDDLPELADLSDWESLRVQLDLPSVDEEEGVPTPEIPEIPILQPDADDTDELAGAEDSAAITEASATAGNDGTEEADNDAVAGSVAGDGTHADDDDLPELIRDEDSGDEGDELLVSEWPDPAESGRG